MSFSTAPSDGAPGPDENTVEDLGGEAGRRLDARSIRTLLAGAAGVAVVGGGALAFVFLGSAPSGAAPEGVFGGGVATPAVTAVGVERGAVSFSASSRDVFAPTVAPASPSDAGGEVSGLLDPSGPTSAGAGTGGSGSSGSASTPTRATGVPTAAPSATGPSTAAPGAPAPGKGGSAPAAPSANPSTGPSATPPAEVPWTVPVVKVRSADATGASFWIRDEPVRVLRGGTLGTGANPALITTVYHGLTTVATTEIVEDLNGNKTEQPSTDGYAVLRAGQGLRQGWMVKLPAKPEDAPTDVPAAAVGATTGTVRVYEVGSYGPSGQGARISVNGAAPVFVAVGDPVPGTSFTYEEEEARAAYSASGLGGGTGSVAVLSAEGGAVFFGPVGAGENAGIRY